MDDGENMASGHETFKIQLEIDSFHDYEESVASTHQDWSPEQVHKQALIDFNTLMFPKQVKSFFVEKQLRQDGNQEIPCDVAFEVIGDKLVHPQYGLFDEMIDNAKSPEEKTSLRLFQETMVKAGNGTRIISLDLSSLSAQNREAIRYADLAVKDDQGKVRLEKRIDLTIGKTDMNLAQSWEMLASLAKIGEQREVKKDGIDNVGILVIPAKEISTSQHLISELKSEPLIKAKQNIGSFTEATFQTNRPIIVDNYEKQDRVTEVPKDVSCQASFETSHDSFDETRENIVAIHTPGQVPEHFISENINTIRRVETDIKEAVVSVGAFVFETVRKKRDAEYLSSCNVTKKHPVPEGLVSKTFKEKPKQIFQPLVQTTRELKHRAAQVSRKFGRVLLEKTKIITGVKTSIALARQSGVGIGVALLGINYILEATKPLKKQMNYELGIKNRGETKTKSRISRNKSNEALLSNFVRKIREHKLIRRIRKEQKLLARKEKQKQGEKRLILSKQERRGILWLIKEKQQRFKSARREQKLWKALWKVAKILERRNIPPEEIAQSVIKKAEKLGIQAKERNLERLEKREKKKKLNNLTSHFALAWIVWLLIKEKKPLLSPSLDGIHEATSQKLISREVSPWLLYAIIWYLAMIRESGQSGFTAPNTTTQKKIKIQKKKFNTGFKPSGVIFAAVS